MALSNINREMRKMTQRINIYGHSSFYHPQATLASVLSKNTTRKVEPSHKTKSVIVDIRKDNK